MVLCSLFMHMLYINNKKYAFFNVRISIISKQNFRYIYLEGVNLPVLVNKFTLYVDKQ